MTKLRDLPDDHVVAVDTETSGLYVDDGHRLSIVSFAYRDPEDERLIDNAVPFDQGFLDLPLGDKDLSARHRKRIEKWDEKFQVERAPNLGPERFVELMFHLQRFLLVFHNAKFDLAMLRAGLRDFGGGMDLEDRFLWDTQIGQHNIDPRYPTGLKPSSVRLELEGGGEDDEQKALAPFLGPKTDARYDLIPWSVVKPYAATDARRTLLLHEYETRRLEEEAWLAPLITQDFRAMRVLYRMEARGIGFDASTSLRMADLLKKKREEVKESLPFRVTPPGAKKFFFLEPERAPYPGKVTDTCRKTHSPNCKTCPQLDEEVQENLIADGVEYAPEYRFHEQLKSAESKWFRPWGEAVGEDGRLRATFRNTTVVTGRLSAERVNLLAIPKNHQMPKLEGLVPVRELFVPKPGHEHWEVDVAQAEVRVGAALSECQGLLEGFRNGVDAHSQTARLVFEMDENHPEWSMHRTIAKTLNLAIQYGSGVRRIQAQLHKDTGKAWSMKLVKEFVGGWHEAFFEMSNAMDLAKEKVQVLGYVKLWNDRIRWFDHQRGGPPEVPWSAFNGMCQGGVAEVMKRVMWHWECKHPGTLLIQTHDALLLELPEAQGEELAHECADIMVREFEKAMTRRWQTGELVKMPFEAEAKRFG